MPFVIRLVDCHADACEFQPLRLKLDPGSRTTGIALIREAEHVDACAGELRIEAAVLNLFELMHRGRQISEGLTGRRQMRRRRRGANLRYRAPRFDNRRRPEGWLAPSLQHRVDTVMAWVARLQRWAPVTAISQELVRFDPQAMENPDIEGVEHRQGTLSGFEVREYLLEKWSRQCAYCDAKDISLNLDHIHPKARGGTNRVANLALACIPCNLKKAGIHLSRVAIRRTGSFNIQTAQGIVQGIGYKHCRLIQRNDGYAYFNVGKAKLPDFLPQPHSSNHGPSG